jgi:hypothetical protein
LILIAPTIDIIPSSTPGPKNAPMSQSPNSIPHTLIDITQPGKIAYSKETGAGSTSGGSRTCSQRDMVFVLTSPDRFIPAGSATQTLDKRLASSVSSKLHSRRSTIIDIKHPRSFCPSQQRTLIPGLHQRRTCNDDDIS